MNNLKKTLLVIFVALFVVVGVSGCNKKDEVKDDNGTIPTPTVEANTNQGVIGDAMVGVFQFTNTSLIYDNNASLLETTVTNTSDEEVMVSNFFTVLTDAEGNEIATFYLFVVGGSLQPHESRTLTYYRYDNLMNATEITYEVVE
ncbi:MAG: hypothetical protein IJ565_00825 [Bacilli bacterium]|nr:hypothetical protein [Bacilli bacterium]